MTGGFELKLKSPGRTPETITAKWTRLMGRQNHGPRAVASLAPAQRRPEPGPTRTPIWRPDWSKLKDNLISWRLILLAISHRVSRVPLRAYIRRLASPLLTCRCHYWHRHLFGSTVPLLVLPLLASPFLARRCYRWHRHCWLIGYWCRHRQFCCLTGVIFGIATVLQILPWQLVTPLWKIGRTQIGVVTHPDMPTAEAKKMKSLSFMATLRG